MAHLFKAEGLAELRFQLELAVIVGGYACIAEVAAWEKG